MFSCVLIYQAKIGYITLFTIGIYSDKVGLFYDCLHPIVLLPRGITVFRQLVHLTNRPLIPKLSITRSPFPCFSTAI